MARCLQHLQPNPPEFKMLTIPKRSKRVRRLRRRPQVDRRAHVIPQLQMPRNKIRVQMRQEHMLDLKRMLSREGQVLIRIPLRIHHRRSTRLLIANDIRSMRQAGKIELLKDQGTPIQLANCVVRQNRMLTHFRAYLHLPPEVRCRRMPRSPIRPARRVRSAQPIHGFE